MAEEQKKVLSLDDIMNKDNKSDKPVEKLSSGQIKKKELISNEGMQTVGLYDIIGKPKPKVSVIEKNQQDLLDKIDVNLKRVAKDRLDNVFQPFKDACLRAAAEAELNGEDAPNSIEEAEKQEEEKIEEEKKAEEKFNKLVGTSLDDDLNELLSESDEGEDDIIMSDENTTILDEENKTVEDLNIKTVLDDNDEDTKADTVEEVKEKKKETVVEEKKEEAIPTATQKTIKEEIETPTSIPTISDDDLTNLLRDTVDDDAEVTEEEKAKKKAIREEYQKQVFEALGSPVKIDRGKIRKFKVSSKPISINSVLKTNVKTSTATWVLPNSGRLVTLSSLSGEEIENLNRDTDEDSEENVNLLNRLIFNTIYNHLIDASKPSSMEEWVKTINWFDINDLYFALYLATFKNSNFITYTCNDPKCGNIFLEEKKYTDMVSYTKDEDKELYNNLLKTGIDTTPSSIDEDIVPVNNKYAIGFRAPSIYDMVFGVSSLDEGFRNKYSAIIGNISYMANMYYIKEEGGEGTLYPINFNTRSNDPARSTKNKIVAYYNIMKNFSSDEYSIVTRTIAEIDSKYSFKSSYHYPNSKCPKCKATIEMENRPLPPLAMVFIRHRLVQLASTMTE